MKSKLLLHILVLFISQLNAQTPELVGSIAPGVVGSAPANFSSVNNKLVFAANTYISSSPNRELHAYDPQTNSIQLLLDLYGQNTSGDPIALKSHNGKVYFAMADPTVGSLVYRPYVTDGTPAGTTNLLQLTGSNLSQTINPSFNSNPSELFTVYRNEIYFIATKINSPYDKAIYKTDGTLAGTTIAIDISNTTVFQNLIQGLMVYNDSLYFTGSFNGGVGSLYKSDGTTANTTLVKTNLSMFPPAGYAIYNNKMVFSAVEGFSNYETWVSDGSDTGTYQLAEINVAPFSGSEPAAFTLFNNKLYFLAKPAFDTLYLYAIDSTQGYNINPIKITKIGSIGNQTYSSIFKGESLLYFIGNADGVGDEPWISDGTTAGTQMLLDLNPGSPHSGVRDFITYCGDVYFSATNPLNITGENLYRTDGTSSGTVRIQGIAADPQGGRLIKDKIILNNVMYYGGSYDNALGEELYKYNVNCPIGLNDVYKKNILLYPNPTHNFISIARNDEPRQWSVEILDVTGRLVLKKVNYLSDEKIDIQNLPSGWYTITTVNNLGQYAVAKFIKN